MEGCMKMDCGWTYGSSWKKLTGMINFLFKYKSSHVKDNGNHGKFGTTNIFGKASIDGKFAGSSRLKF